VQLAVFLECKNSSGTVVPIMRCSNNAHCWDLKTQRLLGFSKIVSGQESTWLHERSIQPNRTNVRDFVSRFLFFFFSKAFQ
jgi:hypothetical protein